MASEIGKSIPWASYHELQLNNNRDPDASKRAKGFVRLNSLKPELQVPIRCHKGWSGFFYGEAKLSAGKKYLKAQLKIDGKDTQVYLLAKDVLKQADAVSKGLGNKSDSFLRKSSDSASDVRDANTAYLQQLVEMGKDNVWENYTSFPGNN